MHREAFNNFDASSIVIMAAAVSDYTPKERLTKKLKKSGADLNIEMTRTKDILKEMGENKVDHLLVGFALETNDILENAQKKLTEKKLDMVVANSTEALANKSNQATILYADRETESLPELDKGSVADLILDRVIEIKDGETGEKAVEMPAPIPFNKKTR